MFDECCQSPPNIRQHHRYKRTNLQFSTDTNSITAPIFTKTTALSWPNRLSFSNRPRATLPSRSLSQQFSASLENPIPNLSNRNKYLYIQQNNANNYDIGTKLIEINHPTRMAEKKFTKIFLYSILGVSQAGAIRKCCLSNSGYYHLIAAVWRY